VLATRPEDRTDVEERTFHNERKFCLKRGPTGGNKGKGESRRAGGLRPGENWSVKKQRRPRTLGGSNYYLKKNGSLSPSGECCVELTSGHFVFTGKKSWAKVPPWEKWRKGDKGGRSGGELKSGEGTLTVLGKKVRNRLERIFRNRVLMN